MDPLMPDAVGPLAPEVGADIRSAQDRLLRVQREMEVTGDASAHLFGALASSLGAMHRLSVDTSLMMQSCQAEMEKSRLGEGGTEKVAERVARNAANKLPWAIDRLVAQRIWRIALIAAGVLAGTNLLTAGGMYLWLRETVASLDVRLTAPGAERWRSLIAANPGDLINQERGQCSPQQGGGTACNFFLWTIPPAPQKAE
jgi:hypothetical protein